MDDPRIPYAGGEGWGGVNPSFQATGQLWATALDCHGATPPVELGGHRVDRYTGCDGGAEVKLMSLRGWSHEWPGPVNLRAGGAPRALRDFDAAEQMWRFFAAHPKRED